MNEGERTDEYFNNMVKNLTDSDELYQLATAVVSRMMPSPPDDLTLSNLQRIGMLVSYLMVLTFVARKVIEDLAASGVNTLDMMVLMERAIAVLEHMFDSSLNGEKC